MLRRVAALALLLAGFALGSVSVQATGPNYDAYVIHGGGTEPIFAITVSQTFASYDVCMSHVNAVANVEHAMGHKYTTGFCAVHP